VHDLLRQEMRIEEARRHRRETSDVNVSMRFDLREA
jgi:hypothetical protein